MNKTVATIMVFIYGVLSISKYFTKGYNRLDKVIPMPLTNKTSPLDESDLTSGEVILPTNS